MITKIPTNKDEGKLCNIFLYGGDKGLTLQKDDPQEAIYCGSLDGYSYFHTRIENMNRKFFKIEKGKFRIAHLKVAKYF